MTGLVHWLMDLYGVKSGSGLVAALVATLTLATGLVALMRKGKKGYSNTKHKFNTMYDSLGGSPAILDPETGEELRPAKRPLGSRVASIEVWQIETAKALTSLAHTQETLANNQETIQELRKQMGGIMESLVERDKQGMHIIEEWTKWREVHAAAKEEEHARIWEAIKSLQEP